MATSNFVSQSGTTLLQRTCCICGKDSSITVTTEQAEELNQPREERRLIQDILFNMSPDQREQVMTGTHGRCFDAAFAGLDE